LEPVEPKLKGSVQGARTSHSRQWNPESRAHRLYGKRFRLPASDVCRLVESPNPASLRKRTVPRPESHRVCPSCSTEDPELTTERIEFTHLDGRVTDQNGRPVARATYSIQIATDIAQKENPAFGFRRKTDATGSFKTPAHFPQRHSYRVSIQQRNLEPVVSPWINPARDGTTFPDIAISGVETPSTVDNSPRMLERTIVDNDGNPVSSARVTVWYEGTRKYRSAAKDGRFVFRDAPSAGVWLFVQADGFRLHGEYVPLGSEATNIVLIRPGEPKADGFLPTNSLPVNEATRALAKEEFRNFVDIVLNTNGDSGIEILKAKAHLLLADVDPDSALALIDDDRFQLSKINFSSDDGLTYDQWQIANGKILQYVSRIEWRILIQIAQNESCGDLQAICSERMGSDFRCWSQKRPSVPLPVCRRTTMGRSHPSSKPGSKCWQC